MLNIPLSIFHSPQIQRADQKMNLSKHILQLVERLVTSSTPFLFFMIWSISGHWVQRKS